MPNKQWVQIRNQKFLLKIILSIATAGEFECEKFEGNLMPQLLLFTGQLIAGVGQSLYFTLGVAFLDDNVKKSKTPALISEFHVSL